MKKRAQHVRIHGRLREQEEVVLRIAAEVLEDALLPELLHVVPVSDLARSDRPVNLMRRCVCQGLVSNVVVLGVRERESEREREREKEEEEEGESGIGTLV